MAKVTEVERDTSQMIEIEKLKLDQLKVQKQIEEQRINAAKGEALLEFWPKLLKLLKAAPLFLICVLLIGGVTYYLFDTTAHHRESYDGLLSHARSKMDSGALLEGNYLQFVSIMSPTRDVLELRAVTLLLGFVVVLLGGLFVLQRVKDNYTLNFEGMGTKAALSTASPGLVLISFGVLIVILALYRDTKIQTDFLSTVKPPPVVVVDDSDEVDQVAPETLRPGQPLKPSTAASDEDVGAHP